MNREELKARTKKFGLRIMKLVAALPDNVPGRRLGDQLLRSGTAIGANYRAAGRARSKAEFISKIATVIEEADESAYWLELIMEGGVLPSRLVKELHGEAEELTAIFSAIHITAKKNV